MNKKFPYIILNHSLDKSHMNHSGSDFSEYKNKNYKIQKYEKFKPKPILKHQENKALKGAENNVKNLLSLFLKSIESEENNSGIIFKPHNTYKTKDKDKDTQSIRKKIKKIKTDTNNINLNLLRTQSYNHSNDNKLNIYKNIENNNINNLNNNTPKSSFFTNLFHPKKVAFNVNSNNLTNSDSQKEIQHIYKKRSKKRPSLKISNTLKNKKKINDLLERVDSYKSEYLKKKKSHFMCESPKISHSKSPKANFNNIKSKIKKSQSHQSHEYNSNNNNYNIINFKNDNFVIKKTNYSNKEHKKKKKITFKNLINNAIKISKNNVIFNEANLNENSDSNINKKSIEPRHSIKSIRKERNSFMSSNLKKTSTIIKKEFSSISIKKNSVEYADLSGVKNSLIVKTSVKPKRTTELKGSMDINKLKRSETSVMDKKNFPRLNTHFKSLKHQIKQAIILRPDEKRSSNKSIKVLDNNNSKKNKSNSYKQLQNFFNYNINKNKKSSQSCNIKKIKINKNINLGIVNSIDIKKKNNSNKDIINLQEQLSAQTSSAVKLSNGNEEHESAVNKQEKKSSNSKNSSFEDYSVYSIKRKNNVHYEKFRILTHKGNVYDSLDDEEFEDEEDFNSLYLDPHSTFTITFDALLFIFSLLSLFEVPLYLAMNHNFCKNYNFRLIDGINLFIECLNFVDMFFGFFRAYYNWEEQLIKKDKIIAFKYFTGWFLFDLIASVPVYTIIKTKEPFCNENEKDLSTHNYNIILNNLKYLYISNRLIKVFKIFWYNQAWKRLSNKLNDYWSIFLNIFLVLLALNYTACLYIFIARNSYPNWILHTKLETRSFKDIYICAIYILIMALTTVGYGDITCYSLIERIFQLILLVVGIMAYSWLVSSFSNYIKKLNERSADFEKKKKILDEIKVNHQNLPDSLYERILRYLKFKNFHEKKLINIIFDCLPVGLKNNLISEMYKPIITNFIFFKNFQNTDFIVRVILCFKPILAYKNDILVNEGDMIEEIMFVKKGVLSVELPINMTNPQENIDKYLNAPLLKIEKGPKVEKIGNSTIIQANSKQYKNIINSIENDKKSSKKKINSYLYASTFNSSMNNTLSGNNQTLGKKQSIQIDTTYVKLLRIRENEHFGDVLMFLEQRSPLRVRVKSKKSELFFLKKMDAIKISTSYQNIWKRINKKSVFNFEQIKKTIRNIVEIYCSVKKVDSQNNEESSEDEYASKFGIKDTGIGIHPKNYDMNNSAIISDKNRILKKNRSLNNEGIKNINSFFGDKNISNDYFVVNNKNNREKRKCLSLRIEKKNYGLMITNRSKLSLSSFSSSSSSSSLSKSSDSSSSKSSKKYTKKITNNKRSSKSTSKKKKKKVSKKLLDVFKGNYKYYQGINQENKHEKQATIISEEPDKESSITNLKYSNSIQKLAKNKKYLNSLSSVRKSYNEEEINPINEKAEEEDIYKRIDLNKKEQNKSYIYEKKESFSKSLYNNSSSYEQEVNNEIYPGEKICLKKEENLLFKKININKEDKDKVDNCYFNDLNNSDIIDYKNTVIKKLLKSYKNANIKENDKHGILISSHSSDKKEEKFRMSLNDFYSKKNNCLNAKSNLSSKNIESTINIRANWDSKILSINNNISLEYVSSYENCNIITGEKLIKNKDLQRKLKSFLLDEITNGSRFNSSNNLINQINTIADDQIKDKDKDNGNSSNILKPIKRISSSNLNYSQNFNNLKSIKNKPKKKIRNCNSLMSKRSRTINSNSQSLKHNSSFNDNNLKSKKINYKTGIGIELFDHSHMNLRMINKFGNRKITSKGLQYKFSNNNINNINIINNNNIFNNSSKELQKRLNKKRRNSLIVSKFPRNQKKRDSLLSQINFNIQKTNQNLNNPDEFYSNYFNFLLEGERERKNQKNKNNQNLFSSPTIDIKRKKTNKNRSGLGLLKNK